MYNVQISEILHLFLFQYMFIMQEGGLILYDQGDEAISPCRPNLASRPKMPSRVPSCHSDNG